MMGGVYDIYMMTMLDNTACLINRLILIFGFTSDSKTTTQQAMQ